MKETNLAKWQAVKAKMLAASAEREKQLTEAVRRAKRNPREDEAP